VTAGRLALARVVAQSGRAGGPRHRADPGHRAGRPLVEDAAAADVRLTDDDLRRLDEAAPVGATAGDRYADMSSVHR
jgi:hypothetical protein